MSAELLDAIERTLRSMGRMAPAVEADVFLYHLSKVAPGERFTVPSGHAARIDRDRMAKSLQGLPVPVIAERAGCSEATVYRAIRKSCQPEAACDRECLDTVPPKEPHGGGD